MRSRPVLFVSLLILVAACGTRTPTSSTPVPTVTGQYVLWKVDALPCCAADKPGYSSAFPGGSMLEIGWNTPPGRYVWGVTREDTLPDGATKLVGVLYSAGRYTWDGTTLTLTDTIAGESLTGTWDGGPLTLQGTLQGSDHTYEFLMLPQLP